MFGKLSAQWIAFKHVNVVSTQEMSDLLINQCEYIIIDLSMNHLQYIKPLNIDAVKTCWVAVKLGNIALSRKYQK